MGYGLLLDLEREHVAYIRAFGYALFMQIFIPTAYLLMQETKPSEVMLVIWFPGYPSPDRAALNVTNTWIKFVLCVIVSLHLMYLMQTLCQLISCHIDMLQYFVLMQQISSLSFIFWLVLRTNRALYHLFYVFFHIDAMSKVGHQHMNICSLSYLFQYVKRYRYKRVTFASRHLI